MTAAYPLPEPAPAPVVYVGTCYACGWEGPARGSNLVALRDYTNHARTCAGPRCHECGGGLIPGEEGLIYLHERDCEGLT